MSFSPLPIRSYDYGTVVVEIPPGEPWKQPPPELKDVPPQWLQRERRPASPA